MRDQDEEDDCEFFSEHPFHSISGELDFQSYQDCEEFNSNQMDHLLYSLVDSPKKYYGKVQDYEKANMGNSPLTDQINSARVQSNIYPTRERLPYFRPPN